MKVSTRIFFCYLLISAACLYYPFDWVLDTMRTRYLEGVEDPLVDQANTLAAAIELEMDLGTFDPQKWQTAFQHAYRREVGAKIYRLVKNQVDMIVYITDAKGTVILHSLDPSHVGQDYSAWRDVHRTLIGEYGARTSRHEQYDLHSSVLYVAAPLRVDGEIRGVLTVGKPTTNITWFVDNAKLQIVAIATVALLAAGLLGSLAARWITVPIKRLTDYANTIRNGERADFPQLGKSEIGEMGRAFEQMQEALEGKRYVEQYIQNLTHEIKSPLSAIRGAAELLGEPMEEEQKKRFFANICNESLRIQKIIDRMLDLSALESRNRLSKVEMVQLHSLVTTILEGMEPLLTGKRIRATVESSEDIGVEGDSFLLHQAVENLIQNAADFSGEDSAITIRVEDQDQLVRISVVDEGTGIADFGEERIFEKFFSLPRPDTNRKSTGLGLNFVREVAQLHGGEIHLENRPGKGAEAALTISKKVSYK